MAKYIMNRIIQMVVVMLLATVATFFLTSLLPGDPVLAVAGAETLEQDTYDAIYYSLGFDKPVVERFFIWFGKVIHLDFGTSYVYHMPVWDLIKSRVVTTLYLSFLAMLISVPLGILFGVITAVKRGSKTDTVITLLANFTACLPQFWVALCLMYVFALKWQILPPAGLKWPSEVGWGQHLKQLAMPLFCISLGGIAGFTRQTRSSVLETIRQDFVRTARSKGVKEKVVIFRHILRNSMIPLITMLGARLAHIMGGSMFVENVFAIPGMGMLLMKCVNQQDIPTIQALVLITSFVTCLVYIITDVVYVLVDPRISLISSDQ